MSLVDRVRDHIAREMGGEWDATRWVAGDDTAQIDGVIDTRRLARAAIDAIAVALADAE